VSVALGAVKLLSFFRSAASWDKEAHSNEGMQEGLPAFGGGAAGKAQRVFGTDYTDCTDQEIGQKFDRKERPSGIEKTTPSHGAKRAKKLSGDYGD